MMIYQEALWRPAKELIPYITRLLVIRNAKNGVLQVIAVLRNATLYKKLTGAANLGMMKMVNIGKLAGHHLRKIIMTRPGLLMFLRKNPHSRPSSTLLSRTHSWQKPSPKQQTTATQKASLKRLKNQTTATQKHSSSKTKTYP